MTEEIKVDSEYTEFYELLNELNPDLINLWNFEKNEYRPEKMVNYCEVSTDEDDVLLDFALSIWLGGDLTRFDLINAYKYLNKNKLNTIRKWIDNSCVY